MLDLVTELKAAGSTILMATHEIGFARRVADRVVFLSDGLVVEEGPPEHVLDAPQREATKDFLSRVMH
jgi:polar amino acid transport system ATP-binding protein